MGVVFRACGVTQHTGEEARDRIDDHQCGEFAACEHIIADGNFIGNQMFADAFIHTFIATAKQSDVFITR